MKLTPEKLSKAWLAEKRGDDKGVWPSGLDQTAEKEFSSLQEGEIAVFAAADGRTVIAVGQRELNRRGIGWLALPSAGKPKSGKAPLWLSFLTLLAIVALGVASAWTWEQNREGMNKMNTAVKGIRTELSQQVGTKGALTTMVRSNQTVLSEQTNKIKAVETNVDELKSKADNLETSINNLLKAVSSKGSPYGPSPGKTPGAGPSYPGTSKPKADFRLPAQSPEGAPSQ